MYQTSAWAHQRDMFNRQKVTKDSAAGSTPEGSWRTELQRASAHEAAPQATPAPSPDAPAQAPSPSPPAPGSPAGEVIDSSTDEVDTAIQLQEMMERLDSLGGDHGDTATVTSAVDAEMTTHGDTLRAAIEAQQNAQRILELATKERADATAQSEQILLEAKAMSARLQKEAQADSDRVHKKTKAWAADQRAAIKSLVADVKAAAAEESEKLRAEAMEQAREEADAFGAEERARHREEASRDAAEIRARARRMLDRSQTLLTDIQAAAALVGETMDGFATQIREQSAAIAATLEDPDLQEPEAPRSEDEQLEREDAEDAGDETAGSGTSGAADSEPTDSEPKDGSDTNAKDAGESK